MLPLPILLSPQDCLLQFQKEMKAGKGGFSFQEAEEPIDKSDWGV